MAGSLAMHPESKSRNQMLHHHCISQDLLIKAHSPPFCHLVLFNILTYSADRPTMPSPILSFSLVHCQLMPMTVYRSNLISVQSNVPTTQGGAVSAPAGHQPLHCALPSCISPNLRHVCNEAPACSLGYVMLKGKRITIALKIIHHCLFKVSEVPGIRLNTFET